MVNLLKPHMLEEGREAQKPESTTCTTAQSQDGASLSPALGIFDDVRILLLYCHFSVVSLLGLSSFPVGSWLKLDYFYKKVQTLVNLK